MHINQIFLYKCLDNGQTSFQKCLLINKQIWKEPTWIAFHHFDFSITDYFAVINETFPKTIFAGKIINIGFVDSKYFKSSFLHTVVPIRRSLKTVVLTLRIWKISRLKAIFQLRFQLKLLAGIFKRTTGHQNNYV